ncbi:unnamed protein product [Paramecium pentaurelia]|uniref:Uncharacterized protein n=1 Tax=Paramecium pentaurelia TaxID=43138 RepID=A0A8S1W2X7_9CILI|nr:unnamed protein product [Paramecium pentaurelia]
MQQFRLQKTNNCQKIQKNQLINKKQLKTNNILTQKIKILHLKKKSRIIQIVISIRCTIIIRHSQRNIKYQFINLNSFNNFLNAHYKRDENYQDLIQIINNVEELINQAKDYQCQSNLFEQAVTLYQQLTNKIFQFQQKFQNQTKDQVIKPESINASFLNLSNVLNDYTIEQIIIEILCKLLKSNFNLDQKQNIKKLQLNQKTKLMKNQFLGQPQINSINAKLQQQEKENIKFKELLEQKTEEMINLKKQNEEDKLNTIKNLENKKLNQKESEIQIIQRQLDYFNQVYSKKYQLQIQQYQKSLLFSNTNKHGSYQVSVGGKVLECNGGYCSCLSDQTIPKTVKIQFAFQMLNIPSYAFVGVGFRDLIQKNNYFGYGNGGQYLISSDRYTCSHHQNEINNRPLSKFSFATNDIIIIEISIELKYIKWTKQNNGQWIRNCCNHQIYSWNYLDRLYQLLTKIFDEKNVS